MKSGGFCEKHLKSEKHNEKHQKKQNNKKQTADSTQISHLDLVFHRVQREGQLGISYILVVFGGAHVFGGACMCMWCMYGHICFW